MLITINLRVEDLNLVLGGVRKYLLQSRVVFQSLLKKNMGLRGTARKNKQNN